MSKLKQRTLALRIQSGWGSFYHWVGLLLTGVILLVFSMAIEAQAWTPPVDPNNQLKGYWNPRFQWHHDGTAVHMVLTRGSTIVGSGSHSQVLYYYGGGPNPFSLVQSTNQPRVWVLNPNDAFACSGPSPCPDTISVVPYPHNQNPKIPIVSSDIDLFCSGHAGLADGRTLITGGTEVGEGTGIDAIRYFDPGTRTFSAGPIMNESRWYPTSTTLGNASIMTVGGSKYLQLLTFGGQNGASAYNTLGAVMGMRKQPIQDPTAVSGDLPPSRRFHSAVFDFTNRNFFSETKFKDFQRMLVFGGVDSVGNLVTADLWSLTRDQASNWAWSITTPLTGPEGAPSARSEHASTFYYNYYPNSAIPDSGAVYILGGSTSTGLTTELWKLQARTSIFASDRWSRITDDTTTIPARSGHSMVYHRIQGVEDRLIVFGGRNGSISFNDVWKIRPWPTPATTWTQIMPDSSLDGRPLPRWGHTCVLDTLSNPDRLIIFGGRNNNTLFQDIWVLTLPSSGTPQWDRIDPVSGPDGFPSKRFSSSGIFDPHWIRLVIVGGDSTAVPGGEASDVWTFPLEPTATKQWKRNFTSLPSGGRAGHTAVLDTRWQESKYPEVLGNGAGAWTQLQAPKFVARYPFMFLLLSAKTFYAGEASYTYIFDPNAPGWSNAKLSPPVGTPFDGGSAVMYRPGRIMKCGGGDESISSRRTMLINLSASEDSVWRETEQMRFTRNRHNLVIIPNGKIMVIGGIKDDGSPASIPEVWDPDAEAWEVPDVDLAAEPATRNYHSSALLLPDGRILSGGGFNIPDRKDVTIFWPPYLFDAQGNLAVKPQIQCADSVLGYGGQFLIESPDAGSIDLTKVALIRPGAVTHQFNQNQRYVPCSASRVGTTNFILASCPADSNIAPPGDYLLFVLNLNGVPSLGKWVRLTLGVKGATAVSGTLTDAITTWSGDYLVTGDVTVSAGKILEILAGSRLTFLGASTRLVVEGTGTLNVKGTSTAKVTFRPSACNTSEGGWWGLEAKAGSTVRIGYGDFQYGTYGVHATNPDSLWVKWGAFANNLSYDIYLDGQNNPLDVSILNNAITVGGGSGMAIKKSPSGGTIASNTLTGAASGTSGIVIGDEAAASPILTSNTITGFSAGDGVKILAGSAILRTNTIQGCKYGIRCLGGTPQIGDTDYNDNILNGQNTHAIFVQGINALPKVRNNKINGNQYGVTKKSSGNPDLGIIGDPGNNDLSGNTHSSPHYCIWNQTSVPINAVGNYFGDCDGSGSPPVCWSGPVFVENNLCLPPLSTRNPVDVEPVTGPPLSLRGVYPNPANGPVAIGFDVGVDNRRIGFEVFDLSGRLIRNLGEALYHFGRNEAIWDGRDDSGRPVSTGLYFIRVHDEGLVSKRIKLLLFR